MIHKSEEQIQKRRLKGAWGLDQNRYRTRVSCRLRCSRPPAWPDAERDPPRVKPGPAHPRTQRTWSTPLAKRGDTPALRPWQSHCATRYTSTFPYFSENMKAFEGTEPAPKGCQESDFTSYRAPWPLPQDAILRLDYIFLDYLENHCGFK